MTDLNNKRLGEILKNINSNPQTKELYESKWHKTVNFLYNNTGLKIAEVGKSGSQGKLTGLRDSDLDLIFRTPKDYNVNEMLEFLDDKAYEAFGDVAEIGHSQKAVHIDYYTPECDVDLVNLTNQKFSKERKKIQTIKRLPQVKRDSIKLAKYAMDNARIKTVEGHEIEKACLHFQYNSLVEYTLHSIRHFTGRIKKAGSTLNHVQPLVLIL